MRQSGSSSREEDPPSSLASLQSHIHESEARLRMVIEAARLGTWDFLIPERTTHLSPRLAGMLGLPAGQQTLSAEELQQFVPDHYSILEAAAVAAIEGDAPFELEFTVRPHGQEKFIWLHAWASVERDAAGQAQRILGAALDITERKQIEQSLIAIGRQERARAAELQALMDAVPAIIWIARDARCQDITGNRAGYEFLQMPGGTNLSKTSPEASDVRSQPYREYKNGKPIPPDQLPLQRCAASGQHIRDFEFDLLFENGETKNILGNVVPLHDDSGRPAGAVGAFVDITRRKRADKALADSQKSLSRLVTTTYEGIWAVDAKGVTTFVNNRAAEILGYTIDEIRGRTAFDFLMAGDVEAGRHTMGLIAQGRSGRVEAHARHKDGSEAWLLVSFSPILAEDGTFEGALAMFTDITERKHDEEALRRSEEQFHTSIESLLEAFALLSAVREYGPDGQPGKITDLRYEYVNDAACRLSGLTRERLLGHTVLELLPNHGPSGLLDKYIQVVETGKPLVEEALMHTEAFGGREPVTRAFDIHAARFGDGIVVTWDDVTEQVERENEHKRAVTQAQIHERLNEQAERDRQNYAREIHDGPVQTLHALSYNLSFLKEAIADPALRVEIDQLGLTAKQAIQELRQVMNELRPPSVIRLGLARAIEMHMQDLSEQHPEIIWSSRLSHSKDGLNEAKSLSMFRIYQEAVSNILRHSRATKASIHYRIVKGAAVLEIRDNGIGLPMDLDLAGFVQDKHFGMAGMVERAESIGAKFSISSRLGEGTILKVIAPRKTELVQGD